MSIFVTGDTHGDIDRLLNLSHINSNDILFIAGDFGCLWDAQETEDECLKLNQLAEMPFITMVVDGNHENFDRLGKLPEDTIYGGKAGVIREGKIYHCKRGEIYNIDGISVFTMGGAKSIDNYRRLVGISWWKEEIPSYSEVENAINNLSAYNNCVDYVITHNAPQDIIVKYLLTGYGIVDNGFNDDPTSVMLQNVVLDKVNFKKWYFGHWHEDMTYGDSDKFNCLYYEVVKAE